MKKVFSICVFCFVIEGVFNVDPDEVKTVIEGDSLTLQADFTETQKDGIAEWKVNETRIAIINKATGKVEYSDVKLMMMFSGRLNLDQTGFLTIWNIRIKHSGEYEVESISSVRTKSKKFKVFVKESPLKSVEDNDEIKALLVTKGNSETLHIDTKLQKRDLILWRFGAEGSLITKGDTEENHASQYDGEDGRFRNRLKMDIVTGSLTINDIEPEHAGEYRLKIISDRRILLKKFTVTVSVPGLAPGAVAGICVVLMLVAAAVAAGVGIYCRPRDSELKKHIPEISEKIKKVFESKKPENPERLPLTGEEETPEQDMPLTGEEETPEQDMPLTGEEETPEQDMRADVTKMEKGEGERRIIVTETALSRAIGANTTSIDRQGRKSIAIRNRAGDNGADVTKMEKGEGERRIIVTETALSRAIGANTTSIDRQGRKSIAIRNRAGDNESPEKETASISQIDDDGENGQQKKSSV
ncbi:uncharacterized protein LOC143746090 [Siphateles boraxobius]|uniref:uncharacterized protein LOC143746090 n=1 Tax=Siphateles boraxobius TaxID=180520 RepID=UPI0040632398